MTALRLSLTVAALALAPLTGAAAQDTLSAGDKVRVTTEEERVVGSLVSADATQLVFNPEQSGVQLAGVKAGLRRLGHPPRKAGSVT